MWSYNIGVFSTKVTDTFMGTHGELKRKMCTEVGAHTGLVFTSFRPNALSSNEEACFRWTEI